jgi:hypothetical protein
VIGKLGIFVKGGIYCSKIMWVNMISYGKVNYKNMLSYHIFLGETKLHAPILPDITG